MAGVPVNILEIDPNGSEPVKIFSNKPLSLGPIDISKI